MFKSRRLFVSLNTIFVWQFEWLVGGLPSTWSCVQRFEMRSPAVLSNGWWIPPAGSAGLFAVCSIYLLQVWGRVNSLWVWRTISLTFHKAKVFCFQWKMIIPVENRSLGVLRVTAFIGGQHLIVSWPAKVNLDWCYGEMRTEPSHVAIFRRTMLHKCATWTPFLWEYSQRSHWSYVDQWRAPIPEVLRRPVDQSQRSYVDQWRAPVPEVLRRPVESTSPRPLIEILQHFCWFFTGTELSCRLGFCVNLPLGNSITKNRVLRFFLNVEIRCCCADMSVSTPPCLHAWDTHLP